MTSGFAAGQTAWCAEHWLVFAVGYWQRLFVRAVRPILRLHWAASLGQPTTISCLSAMSTSKISQVLIHPRINKQATQRGRFKKKPKVASRFSAFSVFSLHLPSLPPLRVLLSLPSHLGMQMWYVPLFLLFMPLLLCRKLPSFFSMPCILPPHCCNPRPIPSFHLPPLLLTYG